MKWMAALAVLLAASLAVAPRCPGQTKQRKFVPPRIVSATNINYPINTLAAGMVTLRIDLDETGRVENVHVLRPVPALTDPALVAVNRWTFSPAGLNNRPAPSTITINVLFNPGYLFPRSVSLAPLVSQSEPERSIAFAPPQVATAQYAQYPIKSIATATVVLQVTVSSTGSVRRISTVLGVPSLVRPSVTAVTKWAFTPALLNGAPVDASTVVAFVFRSPTITNP